MSTRDSTPFPFDVVTELSADPQRVVHFLESYFRAHDDPGDGFSGRFFEQFVATSDPSSFTPTDLVAVSTLSVNVPPAAAAAILLDADLNAHLNTLLAQAPPPDADLAEVDSSDIADNAPLAALYTTLRRLPGLGPTTTSKLLAAKRPRLVPIRDRVVATLLQAADRWSEPMRELAREPALQALIEATSMGAVPGDVSFLRRLDVILWRWGTESRPGQA